MTTSTSTRTAIPSRFTKAAAAAILLFPADAVALPDCNRWLEGSFWVEATDGDVILCLDAGAGLDARDGNSVTVLHIAAAQGRPDVVGFLVGAGADVGARDSYGDTTLHWTAMLGRAETVSGHTLVGADVGVRAVEEMLPLR